MTIKINPQEINLACNRMDQWADKMREDVETQAGQVRTQIEGMTDFEGDAATAFRTRFEAMSTQIRNAIFNISETQIGGLRTELNHLMQTMIETDGQIARQMQR
jgi:hypothetical protein